MFVMLSSATGVYPFVHLNFLKIPEAATVVQGEAFPIQKTFWRMHLDAR